MILTSWHVRLLTLIAVVVVLVVVTTSLSGWESSCTLVPSWDQLLVVQPGVSMSRHPLATVVITATLVPAVHPSAQIAHRSLAPAE